MNEYTMALINDLRVAERRLTKLEARLDILMAMVAKEELQTAEYNKRYSATTKAELDCAAIDAIFGWCNSAELEEEEEDEG